MLTTEPAGPALLLLVSFLALAAIWSHKRSNRSTLPLPPGPNPLPLVGNLFDMPTKNLAPALRELSRKYGDVVYLNVFGQPTIIIGSYDAAVTLLETRSSNTSDRPRLVMGELTGLMWEFSLINYTQRWRQCRRTFHEFFHQGAIHQYQSAHLREARRMLRKLLATPEDFRAHTRRAVGATIMDVIYGFEASEKDDKYITIAERAASVFSAVIVPGRYLVELFPILAYVPAWLPGAKFKKDAAIWKQEILTLRDVPFDDAVKAMAQGSARSSITSTLVGNALQEDGQVSTEDKDHFKDVTGVAYVAGTDTTFSSLITFFLSMVVHPEIQRKAQAELDAVVGPDRLPTFSDREALPYVNAVVKECFRWHSVLPLAIAHKSTEDDEYNGYRIPGGAVLIPNAWAMSRDPVAYPDPEQFVPERFLKDGQLDPDVRDPFRFQFGFGRRVCPGRYFANDAMFIVVALVLHTFDIQPPLGPDGRPLHVEPKIPHDHALTYAEPFPCKIAPRSAKAEALVRQPEEDGELF